MGQIQLAPSKRSNSLFEYWPWSVFYIPVYIRYFIDSLRSGNFSYIGAVNPNIYLGGLWDYSKYQVQQWIPEHYNIKTSLVRAGSSFAELEKSIEKLDISYPLIIKPDKGERGRGVKLFRETSEIKKQWPGLKNEDQIIQEFVDLPIEAGVLFWRMPGEKRGKISSFMVREFLEIVGDGSRNCQDLILDHQRYHRHIVSLKEQYPEKMNFVPGEGERIRLEPIGNHNRGTIFRNANHLINTKLEDTFNAIARQIPEFYFGRFDLKAEDLDSLISGRSMKIIELNGVNSEPAHIYDPDYGLIRAYQDLLKNWSMIYKISRANQKRGVPYPKSAELARSFFRRRRSKL